MAIEIRSQTMQGATTASYQGTMPKLSLVKNEADKLAPAEVRNSEKPLQDAQEIAEKNSENQVVNPSETSTLPLSISKEGLQEAVNKLQDYVDKHARDLKFSIDDDTGRTVVRLLDNDKNVVKQYPSEEVLSLISNLEQNRGLFDDKA